MINNECQLYLEKTLQLVQTLVVKDDDTAKAINKIIAYQSLQGSAAIGVDQREWKYYKHIAGEYHATDAHMVVISMDTLEEIVFSKETLKTHRATARAYSFGTQYYKELVARYPDQELLIRGILNPTDIDKAIAAPNGTILSVWPGLIEVNEYSLLQKMQRWIHDYRRRWYNGRFNYTDDLYLVTFLGTFYMHLYQAVLAFRSEACKTNEAHSFHVRQYLLSHGISDASYSQLTTKQALWLYRNIRYIHRHPGHRDTFEWLTDNILTARLVPLAEYSMRHDVATIAEDLQPKLTFRRKELNLGYSQNAQDVIDLDTIMLKEDSLAQGNAEARAFATPKIARAMSYSLSGVVHTKVLESAMVDYSDSTPYTLEDVLLAQWVHAAAKGYYTSVISVGNPETGERIPLSVKDAYVFMIYCLYRSIGVDLDEIPMMIGTRVAREPLPTEAELMSIADARLIDPSIPGKLLELVPPTYPVISTEAFYGQCVGIHQAQNAQRGWAALQEHKDARAMVQNMAAFIYSDNAYLMEPAGTHYADWITDRNITTASWTRAQFGMLYQEILREATGLSLSSSNSAAALQRAMIGIMTQMSSYSVQIASSINEDAIRLVDSPSIRGGDHATHQSAHHEVTHVVDRVLHTRGRSFSEMEVSTNDVFKEAETYAKGFARLWHRHPVLFQSKRLKQEDLIHVNGVPVEVHLANPPLHNDENVIPLPGIDDYLDSPYYERHKFKDVYGNSWGEATTPPRKLSTIIYKPLLAGLRFRAVAGTKQPLYLLISEPMLPGFALGEGLSEDLAGLIRNLELNGWEPVSLS